MAKGSILETIGDTPLIKIGRIFAKLEAVNLSGSIKDRVAKYMLEEAEKRKLMKIFGAKIVLTSARDGFEGAIRKAKELAKKYKKVVTVLPDRGERYLNLLYNK
jgi:cysteine synthase